MDLDGLCSIAYDFLYNDNTNIHYDINIIDFENISMDKLKKGYIIDDKELSSIINNVLNAKILFQEENFNKYILKREGKLNTILKIKKYNDDPNEMNSKDNFEILLNFMISNLTIRRITKHILLNLLNFDVSIEKLKPFIEKHGELKELLKYGNEKIIQISAMESFYKSIKLEDYLEKFEFSYQDYLNLIFQIIHTINILKDYIKGLHLFINMKNILLYLKEKPEKETYKYKDKLYKLKDVKFDVKIWDLMGSYIDKSETTDDIEIFFKSIKKYIKDKKIKEFMEIKEKDNIIENEIFKS